MIPNILKGISSLPKPKRCIPLPPPPIPPKPDCMPLPTPDTLRPRLSSNSSPLLIKPSRPECGTFRTTVSSCVKQVDRPSISEVSQTDDGKQLSSHPLYASVPRPKLPIPATSCKGRTRTLPKLPPRSCGHLTESPGGDESRYHPLTTNTRSSSLDSLDAASNDSSTRRHGHGPLNGQKVIVVVREDVLLFGIKFGECYIARLSLYHPK